MEQVVTRAVDLMAEAGLEALTLRRLATELGVSAPTLYWHVRQQARAARPDGRGPVARAGRPTLPGTGAALGGVAGRAGLAPVRGPHLPSRRRPGGRRQPAHRGQPPDIEEMLDSLVAVAAPAEALRVILSIGNYVIGRAVERQRGQDLRPRARHQAAGAGRGLPNLRRHCRRRLAGPGGSATPASSTGSGC